MQWVSRMHWNLINKQRAKSEPWLLSFNGRCCHGNVDVECVYLQPLHWTALFTACSACSRNTQQIMLQSAACKLVYTCSVRHGANMYTMVWSKYRVLEQTRSAVHPFAIETSKLGIESVISSSKSKEVCCAMTVFAQTPAVHVSNDIRPDFSRRILLL